MRWDTEKIFDDFGGPADMCSALVADGHEIDIRAVRQWRSRGRIPPDWIAALLALRGQNPCDWLSYPEPEEPEIKMEDIF